MKRRRSREYALQILFQLELTGSKLNGEVLREFWEGNEEDREVREFTFDIVKNTLEHINTIDEIIKKAAQHWSIERMAVIDRNILRAATYELVYRKDIPQAVVINEGIEIAKKYSTEDSASFINGILDKIAHSQRKEKNR
ncbi:MAG TPA: transcription antitermination factor NusB [Nitrospirae bacterium]|nr:transcription antitermination factor NusB [Nitrospirota bacterium]